MKYQIIFVLIFVGCSSNNSDDFLKTLDQGVNQRTYIDTLELMQTKRLSDFGIEYAAGLAANDEEIFVDVGGINEIAVINKKNFEEEIRLSFRKGRGPGEIEQITGIDVNENKLLISNENSQKIILFDLEGNFLREITLSNMTFDEVKLFKNDQIFVASTIGDPTFSIINYSSEEAISNKSINIDKVNPLYFSGSFLIENEALYFGGYSESILKKYNLENKIDENYSRNFVENISSVNNYFTNSSGDQTLWGFTPEAQYSSFDLGLYQTKLVDVPAHNGEKQKKVIDFYDSIDGEYLFSSNTIHNPSQVISDNDFIYLIEYKRGENSGYLFTKYKM